MRPITANQYLYANGNPLTYIDPDGRCGVAGIALQFSVFGGLCNAIDARAIGTNDPAAIKDYRAGQGLAIVQSGVDAVAGTAQLAGDLAVAGRERLSGEDFGASDRIGATVAGGIEVASSPRLTTTDYIERNVRAYDDALANQDYAGAGAVRGRVAVDVTGAVTGAGGLARGGIGLARRAEGALARRAADQGRAATILEGADSRPAAQFFDAEMADELDSAYRPAGRGSVENEPRIGAEPLPEGVEPYQLKLFPDQAYARRQQYGNSPTAEQRASVPPDMEFDHDPVLVRHYY